MTTKRIDDALYRAKQTEFTGDVRLQFRKAHEDCAVLAAEVERQGACLKVLGDHPLVMAEGGADDVDRCHRAMNKLAHKVGQLQAAVKGVDIFEYTNANRLAYACAQAVMRGSLGSRSAISDALLDFLGVGGIGGPKTVPEWMAIYEAAEAAEEE